MESTERASIAASGAGLADFTRPFGAETARLLALLKSEACHLNANGRLFAGRFQE